MFRNWMILFYFFSLVSSLLSNYVNTYHTRPWKVRFYPKKSLFKKSDLIDKGCGIFMRDCPQVYKTDIICARHYDGHFRTFNNYCEMEYENCNTWRMWSMIKRTRC